MAKIPLNPRFVSQTRDFLASLRSNLSIKRRLQTESSVVLCSAEMRNEGQGIKDQAALIYANDGLLLMEGNGLRSWFLYPEGEGMKVTEMTALREASGEEARTKIGGTLDEKPPGVIADIESKFLFMQDSASLYRNEAGEFGDPREVRIDPEIAQQLMDQRERYREERLRELENASIEGKLISFPSEAK